MRWHVVAHPAAGVALTPPPVTQLHGATTRCRGPAGTWSPPSFAVTAGICLSRSMICRVETQRQTQHSSKPGPRFAPDAATTRTGHQPRRQQRLITMYDLPHLGPRLRSPPIQTVPTCRTGSAALAIANCSKLCRPATLAPPRLRSPPIWAVPIPPHLACRAHRHARPPQLLDDGYRDGNRRHALA